MKQQIKEKRKEKKTQVKSRIDSKSEKGISELRIEVKFKQKKQIKGRKEQKSN